MVNRRFDWRLVVVLVVAGAVFVTAVLVVRNWQRNAAAGPETAAIAPISR